MGMRTQKLASGQPHLPPGLIRRTKDPADAQITKSQSAGLSLTWEHCLSGRRSPALCGVTHATCVSCDRPTGALEPLPTGQWIQSGPHPIIEGHLSDINDDLDACAVEGCLAGNPLCRRFGRRVSQVSPCDQTPHCRVSMQLAVMLAEAKVARKVGSHWIQCEK